MYIQFLQYIIWLFGSEIDINVMLFDNFHFILDHFVLDHVDQIFIHVTSLIILGPCVKAIKRDLHMIIGCVNVRNDVENAKHALRVKAPTVTLFFTNPFSSFVFFQ